MARNLIIYYSRKGENYVNGSIVDLKKGNTEICAEFIQKAVGGDLFEVETVSDYSEDYHKCIEEASKELKENARLELKKYLDDISGYESKFLETDPEFIERFDNFAFDEVVNEEGMELDQKTRMTCIYSFWTKRKIKSCKGKYNEKNIGKWTVARRGRYIYFLRC